jgi:hypothetical protein
MKIWVTLKNLPQIMQMATTENGKNMGVNVVSFDVFNYVHCMGQNLVLVTGSELFY